jgi:hypothetical protein
LFWWLFWKRDEECDSMKSHSLIWVYPFSAMATAVTAAPVAAPVTHLVPVEVVEGSVSMLREWAAVAVLGVEAVVHVAVEVVGAMEPRAGSGKETAAEPLRPIVSVWGAVLRRIVEVAIRASRRYPDIDGDPCRCRSWDTQHSGGQDDKYR